MTEGGKSKCETRNTWPFFHGPRAWIADFHVLVWSRLGCTNQTYRVLFFPKGASSRQSLTPGALAPFRIGEAPLETELDTWEPFLGCGNEPPAKSLTFLGVRGKHLYFPRS